MDESSPYPPLEQATSLPGHVKVRLLYLTESPRHLRNALLAQHGAKGPFAEEVSILMPAMKIFPVLECFLPAFENLLRSGVVPLDSIFHGYEITEGDSLTIAYIP